jgi:hypothetical protein
VAIQALPLCFQNPDCFAPLAMTGQDFQHPVLAESRLAISTAGALLSLGALPTTQEN